MATYGRDAKALLKELKDSKEVIDVVVKGIVNGGVIAYVEGVRGFIPASKLALNYVEDTNEYLNKPIQVQVFDIDKEKGRLILSAKDSNAAGSSGNHCNFCDGTYFCME